MPFGSVGLDVRVRRSSEAARALQPTTRWLGEKRRSESELGAAEHGYGVDAALARQVHLVAVGGLQRQRAAEEGGDIAELDVRLRRAAGQEGAIAEQAVIVLAARGRQAHAAQIDFAFVGLHRTGDRQAEG